MAAQASVPEKKPTSGKAAKAITGCGGCGCLSGLMAMLAGVVMMAWGMTDSKVDELVAPGAGVLGLSVVIGFFGAALLIGGIIALRRAGEDRAEPPAPQQPPAPQPPAGQPPPGDLPSWDSSPRN